LVVVFVVVFVVVVVPQVTAVAATEPMPRKKAREARTMEAISIDAQVEGRWLN